MMNLARLPGIVRCTLVMLVHILLLSAAGPVLAERVSIVSGFGSHGQGWLFGARGSDQTIHCWIAVPDHVIRNESDGAVVPFHFTDSRGNSGQTTLPITFEENPQARALSESHVDLAFARVQGKRANGCLSRLGLPEMVYQSLIRKSPDVEFFDMLDTSFGVFSLFIDRVRVDAAGGGLMQLAATDMAAHADHLNQGLSGAIGTVQWQGRRFPFAMIVNIHSSKTAVYAVRFDVIKRFFELVDTDGGDGTVAEQGYHVIGMRIDPASSSNSPEHLTNLEDCWFATPPPGETHVELMIESAADMAAVKGVSLLQREACGSQALTYSVDQRASSSGNWVRVADCTSSDTTANQCRVDLRAPRQFRIRIETRGEARFSALQLH